MMMSGGDSRRVKFSDENRQNGQGYVKSSLFDDEVKQGTATFSASRSSSRLSFNSPVPIGRSSVSNTPNINTYSPRPNGFNDSMQSSSDYSATNTPSASRYAGTAGRTPHQAPLDSSAAKERQTQQTQSPFAQFSGGMNSLGGRNSTSAVEASGGRDVSFQQGASPLPERTGAARGPMGTSGPPLRSLISPGLLRPSTSYSSLQQTSRGDSPSSNASAPRKEVETLFKSSSNTPVRTETNTGGNSHNNISSNARSVHDSTSMQDDEEEEVVYPSPTSSGMRQRRPAAHSDTGSNVSRNDNYNDNDNDNDYSDHGDVGNMDASSFEGDSRRKVLRFDDVEDILLTSSRQGTKSKKKSICTQVMEYFFAF